MSKGFQIAIGGVLMALLLGWYGVTQVSEASFAYYQTLEEFAAADGGANRAVRVHGYVSDGSIERDLAAKQVSFRVQSTPPHAGNDAGSMMQVVYASLETPDLFKDGAEVVVEGRLHPAADGENTFHATNVLAKCPSKFEGQEPPGTGTSS
ncbi:MAG: cytochrome c maturation protein CcmE [bacterium]|nr:cytochrome c maturation protein CcmE [bacterium]